MEKSITGKDKVIQAFQDQFGGDPNWITFSPGRVNIIGEHTDYNEGFVLPMTIPFMTWVALRSRKDNQVRVTALDKGAHLNFDLANFSHENGGWNEYVKGVAWALQCHGDILGGIFRIHFPDSCDRESPCFVEMPRHRSGSHKAWIGNTGPIQRQTMRQPFPRSAPDAPVQASRSGGPPGCLPLILFLSGS